MAVAPQSTLAVRGEAELEVAPDLAVLDLTVQAQDRQRDVVLRTLAERLRTVRESLAVHGAAVERVDTGPLWVNPLRPGSWRGVDKVTGYQGSAQLQITVVDFDVLGEIVLALAGQEQTALHGPQWRLRPDNPGHQQAREQAVAAALLRARQYAAALGSTLTALLELADQGLGSDNGYHPGGMFKAMAYSQTEEQPDLDLQPVPQTLHATVEARFTMTPPDLS
jgi:uncharacterized protein YggE